MTSPDADEPHDIADTQMFRRFVEEGSRAPAEPEVFWMWKWPGLLVPIIGAIIIVAVLIAVFTN